MKKLAKKGKRLVAFIAVFTLFTSPLLIGKNTVSTTQSFGDVWLIGGEQKLLFSFSIQLNEKWHKFRMKLFEGIVTEMFRKQKS